MHLKCSGPCVCRYLRLDGKEVLLGAGHLDGHVVPRVLELGRELDGELSLSQEVCLEHPEQKTGTMMEEGWVYSKRNKADKPLGFDCI